MNERDLAQYVSYLETAKRQISESQWQSAWEAGQHAPIEQIISQILEQDPAVQGKFDSSSQG